MTMGGARSFLVYGTLLSLLATGLAAGAVAVEETAESAGDDCDRLRSEIDERVRLFGLEQHAERDKFYAHQHDEASAYAAQEHPDDERTRFAAEQAEAREQFEASLRAAHEAYVQAKWDAYHQRCGGIDATAQAHDDAWSEPCAGKADAVRDLMEELGPRMVAAHDEFRAAQLERAREFAAQPRSQDEVLAYREAENARLQALLESLKTELKAALQAHDLLECYRLAQDHVDVPPLFVEAALTDLKPLPADGTLRELDAKAQAAIRECMSRVEEFMRERAAARTAEPTAATAPSSEAHPDAVGTSAEPAPTQSPTARTADYSSYEGTAAPEATAASGDDAEWTDELAAKVRALMAECESKAREAYEREHDADGFGSFQMYLDPETGHITVQGKCVSMVGLPEQQMMTQIKVCGTPWVDALYATGFLAQFSPAQTDTGTAIHVRDEAGRKVLSVHDNKRGVINLAPTDLSGSFVLDLADDLSLVKTGQGYRCAEDGPRCAILLHDAEASLGDGNVLTIHSGKATFLVGGTAEDAPDLDGKVSDAILSKRVGATVQVRKGLADATPLGDLDVTTTETDAGDDTASPVFKATLESASGEPTTVTFDFAADYFPGNELEVRIQGLRDDGTTYALTVAQASSLEDVLDATDDDADAEWWVVQDADGFHLLASFSHWSAKELTVQSAEGNDGAGLPVPGFGTAVAMAAMGLVLVGAGLRRRRH